MQNVSLKDKDAVIKTINLKREAKLKLTAQ